MDVDSSGIISLDEMLDRYDFSQHPEVKSGKKTAKEALKEFLRHWDRSGDGMITWEEFLDYYKEVSASIDGDDYFELMIRNAWRIAGGEGMAANTANRRVLVTNKDGSQRVETIQHELGMKGKDVDDVRGRLAKQGLNDVDKVDFYGGYEDTKGPSKPRNAKTMGAAGQVSIPYSMMLCFLLKYSITIHRELVLLLVVDVLVLLLHRIINLLQQRMRVRIILHLNVMPLQRN